VAGHSLCAGLVQWSVGRRVHGLPDRHVPHRQWRVGVHGLPHVQHHVDVGRHQPDRMRVPSWLHRPQWRTLRRYRTALGRACLHTRGADPGLILGPCFAGTYGANCMSNCSVGCALGTCNDGRNGDGTCICADGWAGSTCSACAPGWTSNGNGGCTCAPGYFGSFCRACPSCANGACIDGVSGNGTCRCNTGWARDATGRCTVCAAGYYGAGCTACPSCNGYGTCNDGFAGDGTCTCNPGYNATANCGACLPRYYRITIPAFACSTCAASCATCTSSGVTTCLSCFANSALAANGSCQCSSGCGSICASGSNCQTCVLPGSSVCTSCTPPLLLLDGTCVGACPTVGVYSTGTACVACATSCRTCNGATANACTSCRPGRSLDPSTGACVVTCPTATFNNGTHCVPCDASCAACTGVGSSACTACPGTRQLLNGACAAACPAGSYQSGQGACLACSAPCAACTSPSSCTTCTGNLLLLGTSCVASCGLRRYSSAGQCFDCNDACGTCNGPTPSNCTGCISKLLQAGTCVGSCSPGFYSAGLVCLPCPAGCVACNSPTACLQCSGTGSSVYLQDGLCVPQCNPRYIINPMARLCTAPCASYQYNASGICTACDNECASCIGPGPSACTACAGKLLQGSVCVNACASVGFYQSGVNCLPCPASCATCTSASGCTSCKNAAVDYIQDGTCVSACAPDYFVQAFPTRACLAPVNCTRSQYKLAGVCNACDDACGSCTGPGANACTSCYGGDVLFNAACINGCPARYFANSSVCQPCPSDCVLCTTNGWCISCVESSLVIDSGRCVASCSAGKVLSGVQCLEADLVPVTYSTTSYIIAGLIPVAVMVVALVLYLICRRIEPTANNTVVFAVVFGLFDIVTDAIFVYSLFQNPAAGTIVRFVALGSVAFTVVLNVIVALQVLVNLASKSSESNEWFSRYYPLAAFVSFLSAGHVASLLLLRSNLLGWAGFRAVLGEDELHRIKQFELIPLFVEDLPQLAIQIYMIQVRRHKGACMSRMHVADMVWVRGRFIGIRRYARDSADAGGIGVCAPVQHIATALLLSGTPQQAAVCQGQAEPVSQHDAAEHGRRQWQIRCGYWHQQ
jgi:hypothetical protein